ncbi:MAG: thiamine pyrophosphate-dependent enzyme [Candidatus Lokiarchaeota archaeon]|nr:thiamine pyrophosphate-dependent enzyme [Candidatus Harpocratesius repetitus]
MVIKVSELPEEEMILPGTRLCSGCGIQLAYRWALKALGPKTIITNPASCSTVCGGVGGYTPLKVPAFYCCFETVAANAAGAAAALKAKGQDKDVVVLAWAGDGGTYDIGIQGLSGASERGDNFIFACVNNQAYMNTGIQRSGATPYGATTTTTPILGKQQLNKNMRKIMEAHGLSYIAQTAASHPRDIYEKFKKAREFNGKGVRYIEILGTCPPGWGFPTDQSVHMARLAVETGYWPLLERIEGKLIISQPSKRYLDKSKRKDIREFLKGQSRFRHLKEEDIKIWENYIDAQWDEIREELHKQGDI